MSTDELGSGPLMQHAHGARARELGRLGRLLRPRAGTIWRDLVRGGPFSTQLTSTRVLTTAPASLPQDPRVLTTAPESLPHRTLGAPARPLHAIGCTTTR